MFGLGKKDAQGNQKRIEHRGKHVRVSRTGGASVRAQKKVGGVTLTANSKHGIRASKKIAPGTRVAIQRGRFQLLGRWSKGPFNFNLSKSGASVSAKNRRGSFNFSNPKRSSFKVAGVQFRGQKAAQFQLFYMMYRITVFFAAVALWLIAFPFVLLFDLMRLIFRRRRQVQEGEAG